MVETEKEGIIREKEEVNKIEKGFTVNLEQ